MQSFYFDMFDGEKVVHDRFGDELASVSDAADQAVGLLADLARETLPDSNLRDFGVAVRNDLGADVYRAALIFREAYPNPDHRWGLLRANALLTIPDPTELIRQARETRAASKRISQQLRQTTERLSDNVARLTETLRCSRLAVAGIK